MPNFAELNFDAVLEPELYDSDEEVLVEIARAELHTADSSGKSSLYVVLSDPSNPRHAKIHEYIPLPAVTDEEDVANNKMRKLREFCACFAINTEDFWNILRSISDNVTGNEFVGSRGTVKVGLEEDKKGVNPDRNRVLNKGYLVL